MSSYSCKKGKFCWSFPMTHQKDYINSIGLIHKRLNCIKNDLKFQSAHSFSSMMSSQMDTFPHAGRWPRQRGNRLCHCVLPAWPAKRRLIPARLRNMVLAFRKPSPWWKEVQLQKWLQGWGMLNRAAVCASELSCYHT